MKGRKLVCAASVATGLWVISCETPATKAGVSAPVPGAASAKPTAPPVKKAASENKPEVAAKPAPPGVEIKPVQVAAPKAEEAQKPKGRISQMDIGTLFELQEAGRAFMVDVRPAFFYSVEHVPGAISLPLKSFDTGFPEKKSQLDEAVSAGKVIVLYCTDENCPDGRTTARKLAEAGYSTSVYSGGWKEWKSSGL